MSKDRDKYGTEMVNTIFNTTLKHTQSNFNFYTYGFFHFIIKSSINKNFNL